MTSTRVGLLFLLSGLVVGCGDNLDGVTVDGPPHADANTTDAPPVIDGSPPDAAGTSFSGTLLVSEATVQGIPQLGQGLRITASFSEDLIPPVFDEMPGTPLGCKVWQYTPAQALDPGLDEGTVTITTTDGAPVVPPCNFVPGAGYLCIGGAGAGGTIALVDAINGLWSYNDDTITMVNQQVGRYLVISGATSPINNGAFPIVASGGTGTVVFVSGAVQVPETEPNTATYTIIAGQGPVPGVADPGFLEDDDEVTVALTAGGDNDFEAFSKSFTTALGGVGDDFTLDTASQATINDVPVNGSGFSIGCDGAGGTGCGGTSAIGSVLSITTTDGSVAGLPPYRMPPPTTMQVSLRCSQIGLATITVPPAASAFLMSSGATRISASFLRANLQAGGNSGAVVANYNIVAGHAIAGYTTP